MRTRLLSVFLLLLTIEAEAVQLRLVSVSAGPSTEVEVEVNAVGTVLLESDFSRTSSEREVLGTETLKVGPVNAPGPYLVRVREGSDWATLFVMADKSGAGYTLEAWSDSASVQPVDDAVARSLFASLTPSLFQDAALRALPKFATQNVVGLTTIIVVCPVVAASGFGAYVCIAEIGGKAVDLSQVILQEAITILKEQGELTADEAAILSGGVASTYFIAKIVSLDRRKVSELVSGLLETAEFSAEVTAGENAAETVVIRTSSDFRDKVTAIIKVIPK